MLENDMRIWVSYKLYKKYLEEIGIYNGVAIIAIQCPADDCDDPGHIMLNKTLPREITLKIEYKVICDLFRLGYTTDCKLSAMTYEEVATMTFNEFKDYLDSLMEYNQ